MAALEQGKIDLLVNYDPAATLITERKVGKILLDARSDDGARQVYGGLYPTSVMYANQSFLDKRPEAAEKIARAEQMALKFIADNSAEDIVLRRCRTATSPATAPPMRARWRTPARSSPATVISRRLIWKRR